ncbi:MAG: carbohydrate ABC transporter permease, partial [Alphaproteobacteria bacterium]|nr:carbohydrate ABC transporter permease [Alphaproteobacteria bacterium]
MRRATGLARWLPQTLLSGFALVYAVPLYLIATLSFKTDLEASSSPFALPKSLHFENYVSAWRASATSSNASLAPAFANSVLITVLSVTILVLSGAMAGYWLARRGNRAAEFLFALFLVGLTIPQQLGLVPLFQILRVSGLVGNPLGVVLINAGLLAPLTIFLYTTFIRALPREYEEAALIDGATPLRVFWNVVLPLVRPVTATVVVIHGVHVWNDFFTPLIFLLGSGAQT